MTEIITLSLTLWLLGGLLAISTFDLQGSKSKNTILFIFGIFVLVLVFVYDVFRSVFIYFPKRLRKSFIDKKPFKSIIKRQ